MTTEPDHKHVAVSWSHIAGIQWCNRCGAIRFAMPAGHDEEWCDWKLPKGTAPVALVEVVEGS